MLYCSCQCVFHACNSFLGNGSTYIVTSSVSFYTEFHTTFKFPLKILRLVLFCYSIILIIRNWFRAANFRPTLNCTGSNITSPYSKPHCALHSSCPSYVCPVEKTARCVSYDASTLQCTAITIECDWLYVIDHRRRSGWTSGRDAWRAPKVGRCRVG